MALGAIVVEMQERRGKEREAEHGLDVVPHATSSDAVPPRIAYLADGKVHLKLGDEPPHVVESPFAESVRTRQASLARRSAWKTEGEGARVRLCTGSRIEQVIALP